MRITSLPLKSQHKEARLVKREVYFILDASNWARGQIPVQRLTDPHWQSVGKSFYRWREGATCRNISQLAVIFELGHQWCDSVILIVLSTVNSVPGSVCSYFLEARSQNCGSLSQLQSGNHVVHFFYLVGISGFIRELIAYVSGYYL